MNINEPYILKQLKNGVKIFIVENHLLENDLIIKFKNYGAVIDNYFKIQGFQHLLEHCFFFKNDDYNLSTNASTTFTDMCIEIGFKDKKVYENNPTITMIKKWFFKNNDFTKLNFSRDLTLKQVQLYISELDNECIYRDLLRIPWSLQNFFLTSTEYHYFGGNKISFYKKENEIINFLKNPLPVPTEDINIYLRSSCFNFYNEIYKIFVNLKKITRPELNFSYNKEKFFNKVVQINNSSTNELIFIIDKNLIDVKEVLKLCLLFDNFSFSENHYLNEYYFSFTYNNINDLCQTILLLNGSPDIFLNSSLSEHFISNNILYYEMFEYITPDFFKYLQETNPISRLEFYNKEKKKIDYFIQLLHNETKNKNYIINTNIDVFYKYKTSIDEPYNIYDINFNFKNFHNTPIVNNNNLWKTLSKTKCNKKNKITKCDLNLKESIFKNFEYLSNKEESVKKFQKPSIYFYFESLILYFACPVFSNLKTIIDTFNSSINNNIVKINPDSKIILTNKNFNIVTEYSFLFLCFQISNKHLNTIEDIRINLTHGLKKQGLLYHLEMSCVKYHKKTLVFYYTSAQNTSYDKIINYIKSNFFSNNISFTYNVVKSEEGFLRNVDSIKKEIFMKY